MSHLESFGEGNVVFFMTCAVGSTSSVVGLQEGVMSCPKSQKSVRKVLKNDHSSTPECFN